MYNFIFFADTTDTLYVTKTIGAYKCAHILRSAGFSCLVVDHLHTYTQLELTALLSKVVSEKTVAVGFSTTFYRNTNVEPEEDGSVKYSEFTGETLLPQGKEFENTILAHIKSLSPNCKIMVGGANVPVQNQNRNVDYAFIGFSESSILNVARHLTEGEPLKSAIKNLWGVTVVDDRTASEHDFKNSNFVWQPTDVVNAKVLPLEIARGCIFKCKFCSYPMNGKKTLDFVKNVELIRQELQYAYDQFGVSTFSIVDDTFNDNDYKLDLIQEAVHSLTYQPKFWAYTRIDLLQTKKQIDKLFDIGVRGMYFGIETLNQESSRIIGKGYPPDKQVAAIKDLRDRYGDEITMHGSFMIGLPKDSIKGVTNTFEQLMDDRIPLHSFDFKALFLEREGNSPWLSELSKNFKDYGYQDNGTVYRKFVKWSNDYTNWDDALALELEFRKQFQNSDRYHLPGQPVWSLVNYGYPLEYLIKLLHRDVPWHDLADKKHRFVTEYKEMLNILIDLSN